MLRVRKEIQNCLTTNEKHLKVFLRRFEVHAKRICGRLSIVFLCYFSEFQSGVHVNPTPHTAKYTLGPAHPQLPFSISIPRP